LESISTALSISEAQEGEGSGLQADSRFVEHTPIMSFDSSLVDISAFIINPVSESRESDATAGVLALPLLLTDPHIVSQYSGTQSHPESTGVYPKLPTFDIIDWKANNCRSFGIKVSQWRSQPPKFTTSTHTKPHNQANKSHFSSNFLQPALRIIGSKTTTSTHGESTPGVSCSLEAKIAPLSIRLDLDHILQPGGPVSFFEDVFALESRSKVDRDSSGRTVEEHPAPPRSRVTGSSNSQFDPNVGYEQPDPELGNAVSR
jgi:autophagy-related protein 2